MKRTKPHQQRMSTLDINTATETGQVIAGHGRHYFVKLNSGEVIKCFPRGKRGGICVGDWVDISLQGERAAIERLHERRNLLYRSDEMRSKQFAANIDQLFIVLAAEPMFSEDLTGRALVAAEAANISPFIILNKADLDSTPLARARLAPLMQLGVPVIEVHALDSTQVHSALSSLLTNKTTLLLGQSGMGKSTILNALVPEAKAHTQAHSEALGTGRHTTTSTKLYPIPNSTGKIIDSPGFQAFGIAHLTADDLIRGFSEFHEAIRQCRFYNCSHRHEPGCGVIAAHQAGQIHSDRYALYLRLLDELESQPKY